MSTRKLSNTFFEFLPMTYRQFRLARVDLTTSRAVVAELLRACCEESDLAALKLTFERVLGRPERAVVVKRTRVRVRYPEATALAKPPLKPRESVSEALVLPKTGQVWVDEAEAPGRALQALLRSVGEQPREYAYDVLENKDKHTVGEVLVCNFYALAMGGSNIQAVSMLFDYLDGAVADVVRLDEYDTIFIDNYAQTAPHDAIEGADGVWYVERGDA